MAKKRRRRRASLLTKAINVGILALAFSTPIRMILNNNPAGIIRGATAGLAGPSRSFNKGDALDFYGPMIGAIILKKAISMVRRTARV